MCVKSQISEAVVNVVNVYTIKKFFLISRINVVANVLLMEDLIGPRDGGPSSPEDETDEKTPVLSYWHFVLGSSGTRMIGELELVGWTGW